MKHFLIWIGSVVLAILLFIVYAEFNHWIFFIFGVFAISFSFFVLLDTAVEATQEFINSLNKDE